MGKNVSYQDLVDWPHKLGASFRLVAKELLDVGWTLSIFEQNNERAWAYFLAQKDGRSELLASLKHELFTNLNGRLGYLITTNKSRAYEYAQTYGIRIPETVKLVDETADFSKFTGWENIVVKPVNGSSGKGITVGVSSQQELDQAIANARLIDQNIVLQEFIAGDDHRLLFIDYKLFAAIKRDPASVVGDGTHSVRQLIGIKNAVPKPEDYKGTTTAISPDEVQRLCGRDFLDSIPEKDHKVYVSDKANLSQGGSAYDVTEMVNPAYEAYFAPVIRSLGLRVCGVDVITPDITADPAQAACLIELNAAPNVRPHLYPTEGAPRNAAAKIVELLEINRE